METTGLVLQLYRAHYGQVPLRIEEDYSPCDIAAALTKDGKALTVGVMNPTDAEVEVRASISGATPAGTMTRWHITGPSPTAHNTPGKPRVVDIQRSDDLAVSSGLRIPPFSCAVFRMPLKP
jgi:alpha-N-arabinofuranosidase